MFTPQIIALLAAVSVLLIWLGTFGRSAQLLSDARRRSLIDRVDTSLKRAGMFNTSPQALLFFLAGACVVVFFVCLFAFKSVMFAVFAIVVVPVAASLSLASKARRYQDRMLNQLVPFLRRIMAHVRTGTNPVKAFEIAASEDPMFRWVLADQLANLQIDQPFLKVLRETEGRIPLKPWIKFVQSMEHYADRGGNLQDALAENVADVQRSITQRKRLMGDVNEHRGSMFVLMGFGLATPFGMSLIGGEMFGSIFSSAAGIIALIFALSMIIGAFLMMDRSIRDVERKLDA